ncbi:hypothetical protein BX666DRAFT_1975378 [Dichotomocladium elegans]|nr:hypothetical protein BX666DRAFT_1975378 [Dichotomocladium elegans]
MAYSRSPPHSPSSHDEWDLRGPTKPSATSRSYSTSSRSTAGQQSRTQSITSSSGRSQSGNSAQYEAAARTYYVELKKFLASLLAKEAAEGPQTQRVAARQKLSRLNGLQFHELAMDVYDELMRRNSGDKHMPFLPVREEFHPRRNQARQKLATLPSPRFKDLASDVYHEITRRYPNIADSDDSNYRPPVPPIPSSSATTNSKAQASHATNIIPVKGTINVETVLSDDEKEYLSERPRNGSKDDHTAYLSDSAASNSTGSSNNGFSTAKGGGNNTAPIASVTNGHMSNGSAPGNDNFQSLDSLMADLGNMVTSKSSPTKTSHDDNNERYVDDKINDKIDKLRTDYEYRLANMSKRCQQLETELLAARERKGSAQAGIDPDTAQLRKMDQERQSRLKQLQEEYNRLDDQHRQLQREHRDQQDAVEEVRDEVSNLLEQIKLLSTKADDLRIEKDKAIERVRQLTEENKSWQEKYEKCRIELRTLKASSLGSSDYQKQDIIKSEFLQPSRDGIISHDHIISYQTAIDNLMQTARSRKPSDVLFVMQTIVTVCKTITEQIESHEARGELSSLTENKLVGLKNQFSTALANLLTAAKNHANGMGISPVGLLDSTAGHLTTVVVELVKLLGMQKGTYIGENDDGQIVRKPTTSSDRRAPAGSHMEPRELAEYLKKEADQIVQTIQSLLSALRTPRDADQVYGIISSIVGIVVKINDVCKSTFASEAGFRYRKQGELVLSDLQNCKENLVNIRDQSFDRSPETASAAAKRDLAKEAYEIAKYTKELTNICDR